jgi:hypothetical protein
MPRLSIIFAAHLSRIPSGVELQLRARLTEVKEAAETLDSDSAQWASMMEEGAIIDVGKWRFRYRLHPGRPGLVQAIVVEDATMMDDSTP